MRQAWWGVGEILCAVFFFVVLVFFLFVDGEMISLFIWWYLEESDILKGVYRLFCPLRSSFGSSS